jgi:transposase
MERLVVGVDVGKHELVAALWEGPRGRVLGSYTNDERGRQALGAAVAALQAERGGGAVQLIVEPTGGYEAEVVLLAQAQGWLFSRVNPHQLRQWAKGIGRRAKTDRQDALLLARYGVERRPAPQQLPAAELRELERLLRRREDLQDLLRQERNRLETMRRAQEQSGAVIQSLERVIEALEAALRDLEAAIREHLRSQAHLAAEARRLQQLPGLGPTNSLPLLVLLERFQAHTAGQGNSKALVAFVGLDPQPHTSGTSVSKPTIISRQGNRTLRRLLFMAALAAIRTTHTPARQFYDRLVRRGKPKMVALIALARKLLLWAWELFRTKQDFDPSRYQPCHLAP